MLNICSGTQAWNVEDFVNCGATLVYTLHLSLRERGKQFPTLGVEAVEASSLSKFCPHFHQSWQKKSFSITAHTNLGMIISVASSSLEHPLIDLDPL